MPGASGDYVAAWHRGVVGSVPPLLDAGSRREGAAGAPEWGRKRIVLRPEVVSEAADAALEAAAQDAEHLRLLRVLGVGADVIAPMVARGQVAGAVTFVTTEAGRRFGDLDVTLAEDLATRAALAVDNARLHDEAVRGREEAEVARAMAAAAQAQAEAALVEAEAASRAKSEFAARTASDRRAVHRPRARARRALDAVPAAPRSWDARSVYATARRGAARKVQWRRTCDHGPRPRRAPGVRAT
jgi:hypothetical protein